MLSSNRARVTYRPIILQNATIDIDKIMIKKYINYLFHERKQPEITNNTYFAHIYVYIFMEHTTVYFQ